MNKSNKLFGEIFFWLLWPALYIYLRKSTRSRIILYTEDQVLLVSNWLGPGQYTLPGGGMRPGEDPREAAAREIKEELGIDIDPKALISIEPIFLATDKGLKYKCYSYSLKVNKSIELSRQKFEIAELKWVNISDVLNKYRLNKMARQLITTWLDHNHLLD
jgi:8-oxo-dGTP pyrophosphatase MutT (NUDIX family)